MSNERPSHATDVLRLELDKDGYPTDETLVQIEKYEGNFSILMAEVAFLFGTYGRCEFSGNHWTVATGGWSGCESVIEALKKNTMFWMICWQLSKRGGYYEFITKS